MDTLQMEDYLNIDGLQNPSFDVFFTPDSSCKSDTDLGIFNMDFINPNADPGKFLCSNPNLEYAFDADPYLTFNTTSDLTTDLQFVRGSDIPVTQLPETCQLSSIAPSCENSQQNTLVSSPQSAASGSSYQEQSRRGSEYSVWSNETNASGKSSADSEEILANNGALQESAAKPRKKRGRKRANISEEERRSRKLERGRVAASKCRQKKHARENDLESKAFQLLVERDEMLRLNHDLRDEIIELQARILGHVGEKCSGIPDAEQVIRSMIIPPEKLVEVERKKSDQLKSLLGNDSYRRHGITSNGSAVKE